MGWKDTAKEAVEYAEKGVKAADIIHKVEDYAIQKPLEAYQGFKAAQEALKEAQFFQGLKASEKVMELYNAGKDALAAGKVTSLGKQLETTGKGLDAAGKIISIADTLVDYGKGAVKLAHGDVEGSTQDISRGVAKIALAATGPGALVDKPFTMALQAYAKHDLGRPLTEQEKKDITFTNMAGDGLKAVLKPAGEFLGDQAYKTVHDRIPAAVDAVEKKAIDLEHKAAGAAHDVKEKVVDTAHKVADKAVDTAHKVEAKVAEVAAPAVEVAKKVEDKALDMAKGAGDKIADVAAKVVPPDVALKAMNDFDTVKQTPGFWNKVAAASHAGMDLAKGVAKAHGIAD